MKGTCRSRMQEDVFLLGMDNREMVYTHVENNEEDTNEGNLKEHLISMHVLAGSPFYKIMRIKGYIKKRMVVVRIDS